MKWIDRIKNIFLSDSSTVNKVFHPRGPRVQILPLHEIYFVSNELNHDSSAIQVANLSETGIGLLRAGITSLPQPGSKVTGKLVLRDQIFEFELRVIYVSDLILGCQIIDQDTIKTEKFVEQLSLYFNAEFAALKMIQMKSDVLKKPEIGDAFYFNGPNNYDLYLVEHKNQFIYFELSFLGNYIDWETNRPVRFGILEQEKDSDKAAYKSSVLIRPMDKPSPETLTLILKFLENIKGLSSHAKNEFKKIIRLTS